MSKFYQYNGKEWIEIAKNGKDGKDANETIIIKEVLKQVPVPEIPKVEIDPLSIIDKILKLPADKFKLKTDNIDGLSQTIRAFQSQLGRGYLHGGGISNITGLITAGVNVTITGAGTQTSPYVINSTNDATAVWGFITGTLSNQTDLQNALNAKENTITAGTTLQYWRGDKTFQTLNTLAVPELTNLYFTNARAIASTLTGYVSGAGTISSADSILSAIQKLNGNIGAIVSGVSSVSNSDGTLTISPTIGAVVASRPAITGDISIAGGSNASVLATVNSNVGTFGSATQVATFTVNGKGLITAASNTSIQIAESQVTNLTTDLSNKQPLATNLTSLSALSYVSLSFVKMSASGTFSLDTNTYLTANQTITLSGAVTGSGTTTITTTLATPGTLTVSTTNSNVTAHTHAITSSSTPGAAASILATDASGILGSTGTRIVKIWATDLTVTNSISGSITGNAATATALQNARTIGGTSFDGTANITVATATGGFTVSGGNLTTSAINIATDTTTGTKFGTATNQKISFYNSTPIVQPTGDVITALQNLGLVASATITATTNANLTGPITSVGNATSIASHTGTGTKFVVDTSPTIQTNFQVLTSTNNNLFVRDHFTLSDGVVFQAINSSHDADKGFEIRASTFLIATSSGFQVASGVNSKFAGTAVRGTTEGTNHIDIFDGTAPAGTLANGISLFSASGKLKSGDAAGNIGFVLSTSSVNSVSPTSPNRTLTVDINGTTYYIAAKTTND